MTYLMFILLIIGSWLLLNRQSQHGRETPNSALLLLVPTVGSACAIFLGADLYHWVPDVMIFGLMMGFVGLDKLSNPMIERASIAGVFTRANTAINTNHTTSALSADSKSILCATVCCFLYSNVLFGQCCKRVDLG